MLKCRCFGDCRCGWARQLLIVAMQSVNASSFPGRVRFSANGTCKSEHQSASVPGRMKVTIRKSAVSVRRGSTVTMAATFRISLRGVATSGAVIKLPFETTGSRRVSQKIGVIDTGIGIKLMTKHKSTRQVMRQLIHDVAENDSSSQ